MTREYKITSAKGGIALPIRVVTRATTTEFVGVQEDGALKIRLVAAPAGDPKANEELISFLASQLEVTPNKIEIVAGADGRDKIVSIEGLTADDVEKKFSKRE